MPDVSVLDISLRGRKIGALTRVQGDRSILAFNQDYIDDPERPTLSLSYKDNLGGLLTEFRPVQTQIEPFFSNLLPEGQLRRYLADLAGVKPSREFFLLWALGQDLPGAVTLAPADGEQMPPGVRGRGEADNPSHANALRFSLAGVQLKFSAFRNGENKGLTIPVNGVGGSWIVKLPSDRYEGVPENEFAMMSLARLIGIEIPDVALVDVDAVAGLPDGIGKLRGKKALAVKRFDRSEAGPVHIEDFAQVFGVYPDEKYRKASYRNIARVIGIETDPRSVAEFIRRLVFCTLIGNADMHLKNWSLIYPDGRTPRLSPAYDLLSTIPYIPDEMAALKYSRTKKMAELDHDELSHLAALALLPEKLVLDTARDTVDAFRMVWAAEQAHLDLPADIVATIDRHMARLGILRG